MPQEDKNLVRLATFEYEYEAMLLKNALNDNGVPAWVTGGDGVNTFGAGLTAAGLVGVDIRIRQIDVENAQAIMQGLEDAADSHTVPAWTCSCGEDVDEGFAVCWSCGSDFKDPKAADDDAE